MPIYINPPSSQYVLDANFTLEDKEGKPHAVIVPSEIGTVVIKSPLPVEVVNYLHEKGYLVD